MQFDAADRQRFMDKVVRCAASGCWLWAGTILASGYGQFHLKGAGVRAHRAAFVMFSGLAAGAQFVLHRCVNRRCVNPDHLFLGDHRSNMSDMKAKKRQAMGERHGRAKLSRSDVEEMLTRAAAGDEVLLRIAMDYPVSLTMAYRIFRGGAWTHIRPDIRRPIKGKAPDQPVGRKP